LSRAARFRSDDISGVPVGVTLSQQPLSRALPAAGRVSLPVPRKLLTHSGRSVVAADLFPALPAASGIGCLKAHTTAGGLTHTEDRDANGSGWLHAFLPRAPHGDEALTVLRSRLGGQAFEETCAHGRSIAGRRAVEYALNSDRTSMPSRDSSKPSSA